jgi:predicted phosphate transport protein (TIGR00153 family)
MRTYVRRVVDACEQALKTMNVFEETLETGFGNLEVRLMTELIEELEAIEHDTDRIQIEVRRNLFRIEKTLHAVDVMFMYTIIEWIGDVADRAERIGNRLEQLLAR